MSKIWVSILVEGPVDADELFSCVEVALQQYENKGLAFATTGDDEPIRIMQHNPEYVYEEGVY